MTNATSIMRRHEPFRNRLAARMLVINNTRLDRIPLHSCATWMVIFGSWKTAPSRRKGVPLRWKKRLATSADADFEANSRASRMGSGIGTMKKRYAKGKAADRIQSRPRKKNPPAARQQRNDNVNSAIRALSANARPAKSNQQVNAKMATPVTRSAIATGRLVT